MGRMAMKRFLVSLLGVAAWCATGANVDLADEELSSSVK